MSAELTPQLAQENVNLARLLLEPIRQLAVNTESVALEWVTPTLIDRVDESITALQAAYVELQDGLDDEDGGALGPDVAMDPRALGGGLEG